MIRYSDLQQRTQILSQPRVSRLMVSAAQALTAADGEQALRVARTFPTTIHLLLSDVIMPRLGGMALGEQILRERPAMKVLLLSGAAEQLPASRSKPRF